jgi:putative acetyltransferase
LEIREDDLNGERIAALLREHLDDMLEITPRESVHAMDPDALRAPDITFWAAWEGDELLGCGALRELDPACGEIKSMRTASAHRGRGVGSRMLEHILAEAANRGYHSLMLETGALPAFAPARSLYRRYGFLPCGPFSTYREDPNSVYMIKILGEPGV